MASARIYTPCKDNKEDKCSNYPKSCGSCTRNRAYVVLLAGCKDYYKNGNSQVPKECYLYDCMTDTCGNENNCKDVCPRIIK